MKKNILLILLLTSIFLSILIYNLTYNKNKDYLAIGDGLAKGKTYYNTIGYGYSDYVNAYLEEQKKLKTFNKIFAEDHQTLENFNKNIKNNQCKIYKGKKTCINQSIKNAEIITISIGNYELSEIIKHYKYNGETIKLLNNFILKLNNSILLIKKYNDLSNVILIGFYSYGDQNSEQIVNYINKELFDYSKKYKYTFININDIFINNPKYLPNIYENYPSNLGYKEISKRIINKISI